MAAAPAGSPSLLQRAIAMLARREHSRAELARKLARFLAEGGDPSEIDAALDRLQDKGMLSDERFAATVSNRRAERFGAQRVGQELRASGVEDALVRSNVARLRQTELARAQAVWAKKFGQTAADAAGRARQMRFLAGRGFSADVIRRVVKGAGEAEAE